MPEKQWKRVERDAAALFGTKRRQLSGGGREQTDDCEHESLFIEVKHGKQCAIVLNTYKTAVAGATKSKRVPVLAMRAPNMKGLLFVVHSKDLDKLVTERAKVLSPVPDYKVVATRSPPKKRPRPVARRRS